MNFRKRRARGQLRSRSSNSESAEDQGEESALKVLEEVKLDQAFRRRQAGVPSVRPTEDTGAEARNEADEYALDSLTKSTMQQKFTHTHSASQDAVSHTSLKQEYVKAHLGVDHESKEETSKVLSEDDKLYLLPPNLQTKALTQSADDDVGALSWNTGIAEVALPIEFKLKNIEETESAMKKLQAAPASSVTDLDNLTVNYALRRLRVVHQHPSSGSKRNGAKERSTDDWAFERFKKRHRHF